MTSLAAATAPTSPLSDELFRVEGLTRSYGERRALDGLSFSIRRGEVFGFLGPNGAGKTTAFQVLTGVANASSGRLFFEGRACSPQDTLLRSATGVVFQKPSLDGKLSARENLDLSAALYGLPKAARAKRIEALLADIELADRADEPVERFSGGMMRRLELVRALVHGPRLLIMDEPTQGLDEGNFQRIWARILELRRAERLTVLLTTHRADEAEHCDRLAILSAGKLIACDTPENLKAQVGGDVVTVEAAEAEALAKEIAAKFQVSPRVADGRVEFEASRAHELIPRLVEAFPAGRLKSVGMRRPTLADAFMKLTGQALVGLEPNEPANGKKQKRSKR